MSGEQKLITDAAADGVLVITVNRPEARNAFDLETALGLEAALDRLDEDPSLKAAVITGAGGAFSAGQDLKAAARGEMAITKGRGGLGIVRRPPSKPVVAAVEGYALGGGFELALACDLVVAADDAVFGLPEVRRGLAPLAGGVVRLAQRLPHAIATEYLLTGRQISAAELQERGIVNAVTAPGGALDGARRLAVQIAANGPFAVRTVLGIARTARALDDTEMWAVQDAAHEQISASDDAQEGLRAFLEKREPVWAG